MTDWKAKDSLIEKYSSALMEAANDSIDWNNVNENFEVNFDFTEYLISFAEEIEALIKEDIKECINNII